MFSIKNNKVSGYTLIEILIVIFIISVLTSLATVNFLGAQMKARDIKRKGDMAQIQKALEMYKLDQATQAYPTALPTPGNCWSSGSVGPTCSGNIYSSKFPGDPKEDWSYIYVINPATRVYNIVAQLEKGGCYALSPDGEVNVSNCAASPFPTP